MRYRINHAPAETSDAGICPRITTRMQKMTVGTTTAKSVEGHFLFFNSQFFHSTVVSCRQNTDHGDPSPCSCSRSTPPPPMSDEPSIALLHRRKEGKE